MRRPVDMSMRMRVSMSVSMRRPVDIRARVQVEQQLGFYRYRLLVGVRVPVQPACMVMVPVTG